MVLAREVMTAPAVTVLPHSRVKQAIRLLHDHDITALPVVDASGVLLGIVTEMDLLRGEFEHDPRSFLQQFTAVAELPPRRVDEVMSSRVMTVVENTDLADVAEQMMSTGVKSLPVMRGHHVVGMISRRDLIGVLARSDTRIRDDVMATLEEQYPNAPRWDVRVSDGSVTLYGAAEDRDEHIADVLARTVAGVRGVEFRHQPGNY